MNIEKLQKYLIENKLPVFRLKQIQKAIFQDGISSFSEISTLSKDLREKLDKEMKILSFEVVEVLEATDGQSIKALLKMRSHPERSEGSKDSSAKPQNDKEYDLIETVLISPKPDIWSACISCQVGCQMGCRFCATGSMGFKRNLTAEEITDQVLFWKQYLKAISRKQKALYDVDSIVYMGMGEPFNNWKEVSDSIKILKDENLFGFGSRSISVSTSGVTSGILKLAEEFPQVNLAVSLHFADDIKRSHYMPVNDKDNLETLKNALKKYFQKTKRKVFIEYILLENINDGFSDSQNLSMYLKSIGNTHLLHVNLIRYNTPPVILNAVNNPEIPRQARLPVGMARNDTWKPSSKTKTYRFKEVLEGSGISVTIRKSLGEEIKGACGQLAAH